MAAAVLERYWNLLLPVDVAHIARHGLGVDLRFEALPNDISGEVCLGGNGPVMRINKTDPKVRQRFTIAHETGHLALGHLSEQGKCFRDSSKQYSLQNFDSKERDANYFAAALLMPRFALKAAVVNIDDVNIDRLAILFGVSRTAMELRLKYIGVLPKWL